MEISGLNGKIKAHVGLSSTYYAKNSLGKFTDKNMLDTIIADRPQEYDRIIKLFTQSSYRSNDFTDMITQYGTPFYLDEPDGEFDYKLAKYTELPEIVVNLADNISQPGVDGSEFELVFDKNVFVVNDIITAHRREQEVQIQIIEEATAYQGTFGFKYRCKAVGPYATSYVEQRFIAVGVQYMKMDNRISEYTTSLSSLGMVDGHLVVTAEGLQEYGVEHTMTEYARLKKIQQTRDGKPLDITYYSVTGETKMGKPINMTVWEPTIQALLREEMAKMKANRLMWGRAGVTRDEKGRPSKVYAGLWSLLHKGNVVYYNKGGFSMNLIRYTLDSLFNGRVSVKERETKIYTNRSGMQLVSKAIKEDALGQGFTFNAENYVTGKDTSKLGFRFGFEQYHSRETGKIEFVELEQLNESNTFLEQGPNKRVPPVFIIMDLSGGKGASGIRELKLKGRPGMLSAYVNGVTGFRGIENVAAASKDPWMTWQMKDFTGIFMEDLTACVIIKEYPQI